MAKRDIIQDAEVTVGEIPPIKLVDGKLTEKLAESLFTAIQVLVQKFNGGISHGTGLTGHRGNFDEQFIDHVAPAVADETFALPHGLGRLPIGVEKALSDRACDVYGTDFGSWDEEVIYLKCSAANAQLKLRVY